MWKILMIFVIAAASASVFRDFENGLKKFAHNRVVEHFGMDAMGKVETLPLEQKMNAFFKKISQLLQSKGNPVPANSQPGVRQPLTLGKYLFQNCSEAAAKKATVAIKSLIISPDPVQIPGTFTIQFDVNNLQDITQLAMNVEMYRTEGGSTQKLPCFGGLFGSCDYDNVCDLLASIPECPEQFQQLKIPCQCPFGKSNHLSQRLRGTFSWKNCGEPSKELFVVEKGSISPDPIILPGTLNVTFAGTVNQTLDAPLKVDLTMEKSVEGFWIHIPCIDGLGSCTYDDLCDILSGATCPDPFTEQMVPCKCPFLKGYYTLSSAIIDVEISPGTLAAGDYRFTANLSMNGAFVACYEVTASFNSPY